MITLQFVSGGDIGAHLIEWFSAGIWSHVDAVLPDGLLGARSDQVGGAPPGVQVRDPAYVGDSPTLRVSIPCPSEMAAKFEAFLRSQIGKPYDIEGIAGFIFGRDWRDDSAWFCSELQAAALEHCGHFEHPLASPVYKIRPGDLVLALSVNDFIPQNVLPVRPPASMPILNGAE